LDDVAEPKEVRMSQFLRPLTLKDRLSIRFTQGLNNILKFPEIRNELKNAFVSRFDGDYNILFEQIKNKSVKINQEGLTRYTTFGKLLLESLDVPANNDSRNPLSSSRKMTLLDSLAEYYPLLQVALPELSNLNAENWNSEYDELPIAIVTENIINNEIPVVYSTGQTGTLSVTEEPESLVLVVSQNERVIALPRDDTDNYSISNIGLDCEGDAFMQSNLYRFVYLDDYYNAQNECSVPGSPGGGTNVQPSSCDRDTNPSKDELTRMMFISTNAMREAADQWIGGEMEIKIVITLGTKTGSAQTLTKMYFGKRTDFRHCGIFNCDTRWVNLNHEIVTWDKSEYGNKMFYMFYEYDGTGTTETTSVSFPIEINGTTFTINNTVTTKSDDLPLGESVVEYCDNTDGEGYTYRAGVVDFQVSQKD